MTHADEPAQPENQQPILNIIGGMVALGPLRRDLVPLYQRWSNDFEVTRFWDNMSPMPFEGPEEWYARASKKKNEAHFTIYMKAQLRPIGAAGLDAINHAHRTAEFFIVIGEKECWGKGYGNEVTRLMLEYGFTCLGLHNINLWVNAANERGIRAYRRAGFQMAGRLRQGVRLGGRAHDLILMDCLSTEFQLGGLSYLMPQSSEVNE